MQLLPVTARPKFHLARHVTPQYGRRVKPMHFGCVELVEQHSSTRPARHDKRDSQLSLLCNLNKVMICKLFTNLLEYTFMLFISFDGTNRICVCESKND